MQYIVQEISKEFHDSIEFSYVDLLRDNFKQRGLDIDDARTVKHWFRRETNFLGESERVFCDKDDAELVSVIWIWDDLNG